MSKYLIALVIAGVSTSAAAQVQAPTPPAQNQVQAPKPQTIKKRVCEDNDDPYSRITRICHTVEVPVQPARSATNNQASAPTTPQQNGGK